MSTRERAGSALDLLRDAARWRLLALLLARPTAARREEARRLAGEVGAPELTAAAAAWCANATEGAYLQLLGPGGIVPARAVAYRPFADPGWLLADIARHHRAFAFHPDAEEPADHISVLADFVAYLLVKEAYARERAAARQEEVTRAARARFVAEHVSPIAGRLAAKLDDCGATEWAAAACLLAAEVPPPRPEPAPPPDEELVCGACAAASEPAG